MRIFYYLILFLFFNHSSAQLIGNGDYAKFSKKLTKIGHYNLKDKDCDCTQKIIYLGNIISENKVTFKVLTSYKNLGGKGVNDLVFISEKNVEYIYRVNLPSDFPMNISKNKLYFKNDKNAAENMSIGKLTNQFCTPYECFDKI
ncbi:MAG: hypothetical protein RIQ59_1565 [Bacteroidota bacterium]|jgi:hypothetical protein